MIHMGGCILSVVGILIGAYSLHVFTEKRRLRKLYNERARRFYGELFNLIEEANKKK